jgi:hypothetical protein
VTGSPGLAELKQGGGDIGDQLSIPPPGFWLVWVRPDAWQGG